MKRKKHPHPKPKAATTTPRPAGSKADAARRSGFSDGFMGRGFADNPPLDATAYAAGFLDGQGQRLIPLDR